MLEAMSNQRSQMQSSTLVMTYLTTMQCATVYLQPDAGHCSSENRGRWEMADAYC